MTDQTPSGTTPAVQRLPAESGTAPSQLAHQLAQWATEHPEGSAEWLKLLYKAHLDRMLSDNERIWRTGAIFIPLSIAGFAAVGTMTARTLTSVAIIGGASTALMTVWVIIAENHRSFQQNHESWLDAIATTIGLPRSAEKKLPKDRLGRLVTKPQAIQKMRWRLLFGIALAWITIGVLVGAGVI